MMSSTIEGRCALDRESRNSSSSSSRKARRAPPTETIANIHTLRKDFFGHDPDAICESERPRYSGRKTIIIAANNTQESDALLLLY